MSVNKDAKKVTSLSMGAMKLLGGATRAWFVVAVEKDYIFFVDKKIATPAKFKDPLKLKEFLEKLKIPAASKIKKGASVAAGTIMGGANGYEMTVTVKANGGGKSTLKALLKDPIVKKIVGNAKIVKSHEAPADSELKKDVEKHLVENKIKGVKSKTDDKGNITDVEIPPKVQKALKVYTWWDREGRSLLKAIAKKPTLETEDDLQTLSRRLNKYYKSKGYSYFESGFFGGGVLKKIRPENYDLTKSELKIYIKQVDSLLSIVQDLEGHDDFGSDVDDMVADVEDEVAELNKLEVLAKKFKITDKDTVDFMNAGQKNISTLEELNKKFSPDDIKLLLKYVGGGSWNELFAQLVLM